LEDEEMLVLCHNRKQPFDIFLQYPAKGTMDTFLNDPALVFSGYLFSFSVYWLFD